MHSTFARNIFVSMHNIMNILKIMNSVVSMVQGKVKFSLVLYLD